MTTVLVTLHPVGEADRHIVENMYPLFIHDQWAYSETLPNQHGIIGSARSAGECAPRSLAEQAEMISRYWKHPHSHHPLLVRAGSLPAGFCLLLSAPRAPDECDFYIDEFFLLHPYRRMGVGTQVVEMLVSDRPGCWCVDMKARNEPAHAFWSNVAPAIARRNVEEIRFQGEYGPVIRMQFDVSP